MAAPPSPESVVIPQAKASCFRGSCSWITGMELFVFREKKSPGSGTVSMSFGAPAECEPVYPIVTEFSAPIETGTVVADVNLASWPDTAEPSTTVKSSCHEKSACDAMPLTTAGTMAFVHITGASPPMFGMLWFSPGIKTKAKFWSNGVRLVTTTCRAGDCFKIAISQLHRFCGLIEHRHPHAGVVILVSPALCCYKLIFVCKADLHIGHAQILHLIGLT